MRGCSQCDRGRRFTQGGDVVWCPNCEPDQARRQADGELRSTMPPPEPRCSRCGDDHWVPGPTGLMPCPLCNREAGQRLTEGAYAPTEQTYTAAGDGRAMTNDGKPTVAVPHVDTARIREQQLRESEADETQGGGPYELT